MAGVMDKCNRIFLLDCFWPVDGNRLLPIQHWRQAHPGPDSEGFPSDLYAGAQMWSGPFIALGQPLVPGQDGSALEGMSHQAGPREGSGVMSRYGRGQLSYVLEACEWLFGAHDGECGPHGAFNGKSHQMSILQKFQG